MTSTLSPLVVGGIALGLVVGLVIGLLAAAVLVPRISLSPLRAQLAEKTAAVEDATSRERHAQSELADARAAKARADADEANARQARETAQARTTSLDLELADLRKVSLERERSLESRLAESMAAQAAAQSDLENVRTARAEADSRFAELAQKIITDAQAALTQTAAEKIKTDGDAARVESQAKLAEITSGLTARLDELGTALGALNTAREKDNQDLANHLGALGQKTNALSEAIAVTQQATDRVSTLLSTSQARGAWGEYELRRLIEMTGMTEHVSFDVQQTGYGEDLRGRPDVVLHIAGGGTLPIDSKVPFDAYQLAAAASDSAERAARMADAVAAIKTHVRSLAQKKYHSTAGCIGWTVMFVPIESMLSSVLATDPGVLQYALDNRILIASPLSLMVYLYAFAQGWSYASQQENAQHILDHAKTLVARLAVFAGHFGRIGSALGTMSEAYNSAVGSFERNVASQARRVHELGGAEELPTVEPRAIDVRDLDVRKLPVHDAEILRPVMQREMTA